MTPRRYLLPRAPTGELRLLRERRRAPGAVRVIHRHPCNWEVATSCGSQFFYAGTASDADIAVPAQCGMTNGYLMDGFGTGKFGRNTTTTSRMSRCG